MARRRGASRGDPRPGSRLVVAVRTLVALGHLTALSPTVESQAAKPVRRSSATTVQGVRFLETSFKEPDPLNLEPSSPPLKPEADRASASDREPGHCTTGRAALEANRQLAGAERVRPDRYEHPHRDATP